MQDKDLKEKAPSVSLVSEDWFFKQYRRYQKPIGEFVRSKIPNRETAAEITQEVFLKLFRFQSAYKNKYALSTWLWTIARNTVADHARSQKRAAATLDYAHPVAAEELPSQDRGPEALALRKDQIRSILRAFRCLTHLQRRVVWMRFVNQLSYDEISRRLGLSLNAAKNLIYRAKIALSHETGYDLFAIVLG